MTVKLVGRDDVAASGFSSANILFLTKYTANATGTVTEMHLRIAASKTGNVICGIYPDDGSGNMATGNPLATTASYAVTSGSERSVAIPLVANLAVTNGTIYWLACNTDTASLFGYKTEVGASPYNYKAFTYAALPSPVGTGYTYIPPGNENVIIAGWGIAGSILSPSGIATLEAFGTDKVNRYVKPSGLATLEAFGTDKINRYAKPSGIATLEDFGMPAAVLSGVTLIPSAISSAEVLGTGKLIIFICPSAKIVGSDDVSVDTTIATDTFHLSKVTALDTGEVTKIRINSYASINVKIALYADNAGEPGALLNALNTPVHIIAGWNTIDFPATSIVKDTDYWLAFNSG